MRHKSSVVSGQPDSPLNSIKHRSSDECHTCPVQVASAAEPSATLVEAVTVVAVTGVAVDEGDGVAVGLGLLTVAVGLGLLTVAVGLGLLTAPAVAVGEGEGLLSGLAVVVGLLVAVAVGDGDAVGDVEEPMSLVAEEQGMKV